MANIIESRVTLEDEVFEETIDTMEEPIEVVRPSSYNDLEDLPQVNGVTLMGNKTSEELGIVTATDIENSVSAEATLRENADTALGGRIDGEKTARENADTALGGRIDTEITNRTNADNALGTRIDNEILARQGGDNNLQTQIDAITSKSDVVDVVADYAALQAYDTQHLGNNDVIKVLDDETHNDAQTYYRWNKTAGTWSYIGSEAPYYSKGQIDQQMQAKQDKLTAGTGINLNDSTISADTTVLATKEDLEPEIVADLPAVGDPTKLYLTPTNKTASGNPITIDLKEDVGQMTSFQLDGDTFQQSYTGKNLFNVDTETLVFIDISGNIIAGSTWSSSDYIKVSPNTTYAWHGEQTGSSGGQVIWAGYDSSQAFISGQYAQVNNTTGTSFTTGASTEYVRVGYRNDRLENMQLELGSTATSYEPYVGGQASPNPDYPQPIQTVTGEQTVTVAGKNLFDKTKDTAGEYLDSSGASVSAENWHTSDYIKVAPGENYTISGVTTAGISPKSCYYNSSKQFVSSFSNGNQTITIPSGVAYLRLSVFNGVGGGVERYDSNTLQLETGSTATAYAPYHATDYPLDLGNIELCKLGTYQDYIYKDGDDWKVHKEISDVTLDGSESWTRVSANSGYRFWTGKATDVKVSIDAVLKANRLGVAQGDTWDNYGISGSYTPTRIFIRDALFNDMTVEQLQEWLTTHNIIAYYTLATPTDTTITNQTLIAQLEAIRKAALENGTNIITNTATGANLAGSMSIGYYGYNPSEYSEWLYVDGTWEQVGGRPFPTNISEFNNDANFVSENELQGIIAPKLQTEIVAELPATGDESKLYLTPKAHTTQTATGNPITATVSDGAGSMDSFQLDGDTYQQTYTGINLARNAYKIQTVSGVTFTALADGSITANGTATDRIDYYINSPTKYSFPAGTYTLSTGGSDGTSETYFVYVDNTTGQNWSSRADQSNTITSNYDFEASVRIVVRSGVVFNNVVFKIQIEAGSTPTAFQPYVGGVPSPNPDYPQPIQTVTGEQTVEIVGKNLFDIDSIITGYELISATGEVRQNVDWWVTPLIPVKAGAVYTSSNMRVPNKVFYAADGSFISTSSTQTATAPAGARYMRMNAKLTDTPDYTGKAQLELGSTATAYTPYSKQTLPLDLGNIELCKLGTYQDYIWEDGENWKVHKEIGYEKRITNIAGVDGTASVYGTATTSNGAFTIISTNWGSDYATTAGSAIASSTIGVYQSQELGSNYAANSMTDGTFCQRSGTNDRVYFRFASWARVKTVDEVQQMFANNGGADFWYPLATPTDTIITDTELIAQLEAIRTAALENGANTITNTVTEPNLAGDMEIGYYGYNPRNRYDKWLWLDLNNNYEQIGS